MAKSLSTRIADRAVMKAERIAKKKPSPNEQNRALFLVLREDIKLALADGWPIKTIWETLHEEKKIPFGYQAFRGYVIRLILRQEAAPVEPPKPIPEQKESAATLAAQTGPGGFVLDPNPKKEDLI